MAWQVIAIWTLVVPTVLWFLHDERQEQSRPDAAKGRHSAPSAQTENSASTLPTIPPALSPAYRAFLQNSVAAQL